MRATEEAIEIARQIKERAEVIEANLTEAAESVRQATQLIDGSMEGGHEKSSAGE